MAETRRAASPPVRSRADYPYSLAIATRWLDDHVYGHVNNVVYYAYFDTVVNEHLIRAGGLDFTHDSAIGIVAETSCVFRKSLSFPDTIDAGIAVTKLGNSSVAYEIALFRQGDEALSALGRFVHVWVDRASQRPVRIPPNIRAALEPLRIVR